MLGEQTVLFGVLAGRGPGCTARSRLKSFTQFAGNANLSSLLGPTLINR
jgi:hypothetical protein